MEYRRRHVIKTFDEENPRTPSSQLVDEAIYEHNEYVYNGYFYSWRTICKGIKYIICPCLRKATTHFIVNDDQHYV